MTLNHLDRSAFTSAPPRSAQHQRLLHSCLGCVHKVVFDRSQPMVLYVADDSGSVSRVDIRSHTPSVPIFTRTNITSLGVRTGTRMGLFGAAWRGENLSVKSFAQFSDPHFMLVGGNGREYWMNSYIYTCAYILHAISYLMC